MFSKKPKKNSKVKVGTGIKLKSKKVMFLSMVGVLFLASVGYGGFNYWKGHQLKAKAANYTSIATWSGVSVKPCVNYFSGYGGGYQMNVYFEKASSTRTYGYSLRKLKAVKQSNGRFRYDDVKNQWSNGYWGGTVGALSDTFSLYNNEYAIIYVNQADGTYPGRVVTNTRVIPGDVDFSRLSRC